MLRRGGELDGARILSPTMVARAHTCCTGDKPNELYRKIFEARGWEVLPAYIGLEAALSFLGVGVIPPVVTFGAMLAKSVQFFNVVPSYLFIPGTILVILVVSFNLVGDALRDALDPKSNR